MKLFYRISVILLSIVFFPLWIITVMFITVSMTPVSVAEYVMTGECNVIKKVDKLLYDKCGDLFFNTIDKFTELTK